VELESIGLQSAMGMKGLIEMPSVLLAAAIASNNHNCQSSLDCPLRGALWTLKTEVDRFVTGTRGLCLDCVKAGRATTGLNMPINDKAKCRMGHSESKATP